MSRAIGTAALRGTGLVMVVGALAIAAAPRPEPTPYIWWIVLTTGAVALLLVLLRHSPASLDRLLASRLVAPVVALVGAALATLLAEATRYHYGWDASIVMAIARRLHEGPPLTAYWYHYLSMWPNNFPLLLIDRMGYAIGPRLGVSATAALVVLNGICLAVTLWLTHVTVRRVAGPTTAFVAMLLVLLLVGVSPWMTLPYTDIFAMPFVTAVPALAGHAWTPGGWSRWVAWAGAVACASIAYQIKTTPIVVIIALLIVVLIGVRVRRRFLAAVLVAAVSLGGFLLASTAVHAAASTATGVNLTQVHTAEAPPPLWWVANGMNFAYVNGLPRWGSYSRPMAVAIQGMTPSEMDAYARNYMSTTWDKRGPAGMAGFYADKALWNWGDGMFWAYFEGTDFQNPLVATSPVSTTLAQVNNVQGAGYALRASLTEGVWLAVMLVAGVGLLRVPWHRNVLLLALITLGIGAFALLSQGRSRYLLSFVPIVVALGGTVMPWVPRIWGRRSRRPVPTNRYATGAR